MSCVQIPEENQAAALLCVLSRWLNRYEAELPEGVMGGMGWRLRGPEGLRAK